jgi:hypothetical protein
MPVARLRASLSEALGQTLEFPEIPTLLEKELEQLRRMVAAAGALVPPRDRMREAVENFWRYGEFQSLIEARLVCFGCADRFAGAKPALIEDRRAFPRFLGAVDQYSQTPRPFRRCYRGLLHAYFSYDGEGQGTSDVGRENWRELRTYLQDREPAIRVSGPQPDWAETIQGNTNLLTADPASRYAQKLLEGDTSEVDQLRARLEVNAGSWLMRKLILAHITLACEQTDHRFRVRVDALLSLLQSDPIVADEGLAMIVDRYANIPNRTQHGLLLETAIGRWGNPTFKRNAAAWHRASLAARSMIAGWATLDLIKRFFEILSDDRRTDRRRVEFWQKYHDQIQLMYFALGSAAMASRDADIVRLRKDMGDQLIRLKRAGDRSNNAFIMMLGDLVVVEFGVKGNACFLYKNQSIPFDLRAGLTLEELKSDDNLARLTHADRGGQDWEEKFADALSSNGVRAGTPARRQPAQNPESSLTRGPRDSRRDVSGTFNRDAFQRFVREHSLAVVDNTHVGGILKVMTDAQEGSVASALERWRFEYSDKRHFWWRRGWEP